MKVKLNDAIGLGMSGKMGNLIFYQRNGQTYVRRVQVPGKKRKWETEGRSERQQASTARFRMTQAYYSYFRRHVSEEIWRTAAQAEGRMAHNLFHAENFVCFNGKGAMEKPELLHFSAGRVQLRGGLEVVPMGGGRFEARWKEGEAWEYCLPGDELRVGVVYDRNLNGPCWAEEASGRREDCRGEFRLNATKKDTAHVYLFFAREDGTAYSPSAHFLVAVGD